MSNDTLRDLIEKEDGYAEQTIEINELMEVAYTFAKKHHEGQTRDEGTPYFNHVERVALMSSNNKNREMTYITAILHDVVEDTDVTIDDINNIFWNYIGMMVETLTHYKGVSDEDYLKNIVHCKDFSVFKIKLCDRLDNINSLLNCGNEKKIERYINENRNIFLPIMQTHDLSQKKDFKDLIEKIRINIEDIITKKF